MGGMSDGWKYRCLEWTVYLVVCGVGIAATLALVSLIIPTAHFDIGPLFLLAAWLVFRKLRSPDRAGPTPLTCAIR